MQKKLEPLGWKDHGIVNTEHSIGKQIEHQWIYPSEVKLILKLHSKPDAYHDAKHFEMDRILTDTFQVQQMVTYFVDAAIRRVKQQGFYINTFWIGTSLEKLEQFCQESRLPLPPNIEFIGMKYHSYNFLLK